MKQFLPNFMTVSMAIVWLTGCTTNSIAKSEHMRFADYAQSRAHPYGQMNPAAPEAIKEYAFLVGDWNCDEHRRTQGQWVETNTTMRGEYFLNGYGILNHTFSADSVSSMTYEYDTKTAKWMIVNTGAPIAKHSVWQGGQEGNERIARTDITRPNGDIVPMQIRFHDISTSSFAWKLEAITPNGPFTVREKTCHRIES